MSSKKRRRPSLRSDNNVEHIYEAENHELSYAHRFTCLSDIQTFVNRVTASAPWEALGNVPRYIRVFDWGDNESSEARGSNEIWLARKHWDLQVILHELAHHVSPKTRHGPAWVRAYLLLIQYFMGQFYMETYAKAFKRIGVKL